MYVWYYIIINKCPNPWHYIVINKCPNAYVVVHQKMKQPYSKFDNINIDYD